MPKRKKRAGKESWGDGGRGCALAEKGFKKEKRTIPRLEGEVPSNYAPAATKPSNEGELKKHKLRCGE